MTGHSNRRPDHRGPGTRGQDGRGQTAALGQQETLLLTGVPADVASAATGAAGAGPAPVVDAALDAEAAWAAGETLLSDEDVATAEPLVVCVGGPMAGHWYTARDWTERRAAATHMAERGQHAGPSLGYTRAERTAKHPQLKDTTGDVWQYNSQPTSRGDHSNTEQHHADQDRAGQDRAGRDSTGRDSTDGGGQALAGQARSGGQPAVARRVLVTGSRTWTGTRAVHEALDRARAQLAPGESLTVVHGANPRGADAMAHAWVTRRQAAGDAAVRAESHPADWNSHGRRAGMLRNQEMVRAGADECLAFVRNASPGATHCADLADAAGIPTTRHAITDASTPQLPVTGRARGATRASVARDAVYEADAHQLAASAGNARAEADDGDGWQL